MFLVLVAAFEPYANNGGSIAGIAGSDFAVVAADTQLIVGSSIRGTTERLLVIDDCCIGAAGCAADARGVLDLLALEARNYAWREKQPMSVTALARLTSMALYQRRGFPYYALTIVAGPGALYAYDSLGSFAPVAAVAAGSAQKIIQPVLDEASVSSVEDAIDVLRRAFTSAARRDVAMGTTIHLAICTAKNVEHRRLTLV